jgi:hypothetical protein
VKLWPLPEALLSKGMTPDSSPTLLQAQTTQRCHDKVTTSDPWGGSIVEPLLG